MAKTLEKKLEKLRETLTDMKQVLVAYSGGVDSTFLLAIAKQTLNHHVHAITIASPLTPQEELTEASELANTIGATHHILPIGVLKHQSIKTNQHNRCYLCKIMIFTHLQHIAKKNNHILLEGTTADDTTQYRPGRKALQELNIRSPLVEVGLTKQEIRASSKHMGLPTWNKPASPCLATRFPYNTTLTPTKLTQVAQAEHYLKTLGFTIVRVRHHDHLARIEVPPSDIPHLLKKTDEIHTHLQTLGYHFITIDLKGYRRGCYDGEKTI